MNKIESNQWFIESLTADELYLRRIKKVIYSKKTKYQLVELLESFDYGKILYLDGKTQSAELDEVIYHEALVHPALIRHDSPKSVFVAGGGEGATLREILKYKSVKKVVMVDIDEEVVNICRKYLKEWHQGAFESPKLKLYFTDARQFLQKSKDKYDIIIIDCPDPLEGGPAYLLFTQQFYEICQRHLNKKGIIAVQSGTTNENNISCFVSIYLTLSQTFTYTLPYQVFIPSYANPWGFIIASDFEFKEFTSSEIDNRLEKREVSSLRFYDGQTDTGIFSLPKNIRKALEEKGRIITDNNPLFVE